MPKDQFDDMDQEGYSLTLNQVFLLLTLMYFVIRSQMVIKPLPKLLVLRTEDKPQEILYSINNLLYSDKNKISENFKEALTQWKNEIENEEAKHTHKSAMDYFKAHFPAYFPIMICILRVDELKDTKNIALQFVGRNSLINSLNDKILKHCEYIDEQPTDPVAMCIARALQHLHQLDEFILQWTEANKKVKFKGLDGFVSLTMHLVLQNAYSAFTEGVDNPNMVYKGANFQLEFYANLITRAQDEIMHERNKLTDPSYKPFVRHLDQILQRKPIPVTLDDPEMNAQDHTVLLAKNPHLHQRYSNNNFQQPRYWVSYGVTVEDSMFYGHTVIVLSHQDTEKDDIIIDHCVGYYSGAWVIGGAAILKPFCEKGAKLKPEKVPYMLLEQLYKHWELTKEEYDIVKQGIESELFKKGSFDMFNKNCKHWGLDLLKKINIFSPEIEGGVFGFMPSCSDGLKRGKMVECATIKENKVVARDKFDCSPMVWSADTAVQLREHAERSPAMVENVVTKRAAKK